MANSLPGLARLGSATGETMTVAFKADYSGVTAGSSAWSVVARQLRITVALPAAASPPPWILAQVLARTEGSGEQALVDQVIILQQDEVNVFSGLAPYDLLIRSGEGGMTTSYEQRFEFTLTSGSFDVPKVIAVMDDPSASLIDPVNGTPHFQTNLFFATPYATKHQSDWDTL
jgi:hypothetical protein